MAFFDLCGMRDGVDVVTFSWIILVIDDLLTARVDTRQGVDDKVDACSHTMIASRALVLCQVDARIRDRSQGDTNASRLFK